jgi:hypothetical protein
VSASRGALLALGLFATLGATLGSLAGCVKVTTQRWPGPMDPEVRPLPPGDSKSHLQGPEEVVVLRHADPVRVRPAGTNSGRPLAFYDKLTRLSAGSQVVVAAGGRAEILWPEGSTVMLYDNAVAWIGSPSRGEEILDLSRVERARIMLRPEDRVRLVGGAVLYGEGGPYTLHLLSPGTLAVHNQSKGSTSVAFREEVFLLGPGQRVVLPLLSAGGRPIEPTAGVQRLPGPGFTVGAVGEVESSGTETELSVSASGESLVDAFGVRVRLAPGARATFGDLGPTPQSPADDEAYSDTGVPAEEAAVDPDVPDPGGVPEAPAGDPPEEQADDPGIA